MNSTYIHPTPIGEGVIRQLFPANKLLKVTDEVPHFQLDLSKPNIRALHRVDPKSIDPSFENREKAQLLLEAPITLDGGTPSKINASLKLEDAPLNDSPLHFQLMASQDRPSIYKIHLNSEIPNSRERLSKEEAQILGDFITNIIDLSIKENKSENILHKSHR